MISRDDRKYRLYALGVEELPICMAWPVYIAAMLRIDSHS
jgi:hypothetical protein